MKTGQALLSAQNPGAPIHALVIGVQVVLLWLLYAQTASFDYVYFDDADYVLDNPAVRAGLTLDGVHWAFTSFYASNWHPLTWMSHMVDVSLFSVDPGWAHVHNAVLHGINSLLVYAILLRWAGRWDTACLLSLIFLVHPLHVESVAWIAERKDLLCALFFLLGILLYDRYRANPGKWRYTQVLLCFILALLSKPMAVTFPVVLLVLDFFVYRTHFSANGATASARNFDYMRAIVEKLPLLALAAMSSAVTIAAQVAGNALAYLESRSLESRWWTASSAYVIYLRQMLQPVNLVAFYPLTESSSLLALLLPGALLGLLLALALAFARRYPLAGAGLCWYLVTLLPVIGLVQVGSQAHADRYLYLPSVGVLMSCVYLLPARGKKYFQLTRVIACIVIAYFAVLCYWQVGYWKNQHVLFSRVLAVVGPNHLSHIHLAKDYIQRGMLKEAREQSLAALALRPDLSDADQAIANIALAERNFAEAEKHYRLALSKGPSLPNVVNNLGIALAEQGDLPGAMRAFQKALEIQPDMPEAQANLQRYGSRLERAAAP